MPTIANARPLAIPSKTPGEVAESNGTKSANSVRMAIPNKSDVYYLFFGYGGVS